MPIYVLIVRRYVPDELTGDELTDWALVVGESLVDRYDIGHKLVYAIEAKKHVSAFLSELDIEIGSPPDIFPKLFEYYLSSTIFTTIANNLVEAFYKLDFDGNLWGFFQATSNAQYLANEELRRMKYEDISVSLWILANPLSRLVTLIYIVGTPSRYSAGFGRSPYGLEPYGDISGNFSPVGYGLQPYGETPYGYA